MMRTLLLFDIDGTLVAGGPAKQAFHVAMLATYGTAGPIETHEFSGKTDPQIARELLREDGLSDAEIDHGLPRLVERYLSELETRLPDVPMRVLPGVETLMTALTDVALAPQIGLGLVTGNVAGGADLKLRGPRLRDPFLIGAFGSDSEERNHLPGLALERARRHWSTDFAAERVWVIGDTPRDVECGQAHGLRTLAVATGNFSAEVLEATGADAVVEDFSDTSAVIDLLMDEPNRT